ncbi:hypothetical protein GX888_02940, partial [Candidatus Dojkabacteria bacterium]|nr:hypothetical protein [Candidatus Dojkabacteria bacterium]
IDIQSFIGLEDEVVTESIPQEGTEEVVLPGTHGVAQEPLVGVPPLGQQEETLDTTPPAPITEEPVVSQVEIPPSVVEQSSPVESSPAALTDSQQAFVPRQEELNQILQTPIQHQSEESTMPVSPQIDTQPVVDTSYTATPIDTVTDTIPADTVVDTTPIDTVVDSQQLIDQPLVVEEPSSEQLPEGVPQQQKITKEELPVTQPTEMVQESIDMQMDASVPSQQIPIESPPTVSEPLPPVAPIDTSPLESPQPDEVVNAFVQEKSGKGGTAVVIVLIVVIVALLITIGYFAWQIFR